MGKNSVLLAATDSSANHSTEDLICRAMENPEKVNKGHQEEKAALVVADKVDWKGRKALKHEHGGMKSSLLILTTFGFENLATFSLAVNSVGYFNGIMHFDIIDAANMLTNYMGTSYLLAILVAVVADTWFGRFKAVIVSGCFEFFGLVLLTVQAHYPHLKPPPCVMLDPQSHCETLSGGHKALLFLGLYLLAFGSSGIKAALPSHGADQFDDKDPKEASQMSTFFNYLLVAVCLGGAVSLTLVVYVQDNKGWDWGFGISAIAILLALIIFASGLPLYRLQIVQGTSAIIEIIQVFVAAFRNINLRLPADPAELYEIERDKEPASEIEFLPHRDIYRFLDKAAIKTKRTTEVENCETPNPWKLCRVTQVENAKIILGMVPIFCCTIIMTLCLAQLQTFSIQQGRTMDSHISKSFKIPPASLPIIPILFLIIIVPVYDLIFVPLLRKITGIPTGITNLQRIGVGLILSCISMALSAVIEVKRKQVARDHNMLDAIPFFYSEAPKSLKSTSTCFLWTSMAVGYFLSTIVVKSVNSATKNITRSGGWLAGNNINRNHLNLFYLFLSVVSFINFCIYLIVSSRYKYRTQVREVKQGGSND
ncbi:protein NRT1/ PTR FAMILY 4.5-like isoform X2 [Prosopis cineraria]|uniref:protein NRT1/ PTR FAMILY 4.5-like isoform X2 n=1 Tax=Prosopis cineraria TaxID=364024 RepID=UPI00241030EA|nr:protein NRT1/ PTR FAMILY 4.5-like isoform X2 [Prosopis cineraria]